MSNSNIPPDAVLIHASIDEDDPPAYHVRDQERVTRDLPVCTPTAVASDVLESVRARRIPATLSLPAGAAAAPLDADDFTSEGWRWPGGDTLELSAWRDPALPGLHMLTLPPRGADACHVTVCGRPMRVVRVQVPSGDGASHLAELTGFLDENTRFAAVIRAVSPERRDALLAAVSTLRLADVVS